MGGNTEVKNMYRPAIAIDAIGRDEPIAREIALGAMGEVLIALTNIDKLYLVHFPETKLLYDSGVRYVRLPPEPGTTCGDDDWQDLPTTYRRKAGDCEDLACIRAAEMQVNGIDVQPYIKVGTGKNRHKYHIVCSWPEGLSTYPDTVYRDKDGVLIEDPSKVLGM